MPVNAANEHTYIIVVTRTYYSVGQYFPCVYHGGENVLICNHAHIRYGMLRIVLRTQNDDGCWLRVTRLGYNTILIGKEWFDNTTPYKYLFMLIFSYLNFNLKRTAFDKIDHVKLYAGTRWQFEFSKLVLKKKKKFFKLSKTVAHRRSRCPPTTASNIEEITILFFYFRTFVISQTHMEDISKSQYLQREWVGYRNYEIYTHIYPYNLQRGYRNFQTDSVRTRGVNYKHHFDFVTSFRCTYAKQ